jgi:hypothetical protein
MTNQQFNESLIEILTRFNQALESLCVKLDRLRTELEEEGIIKNNQN